MMKSVATRLQEETAQLARLIRQSTQATVDLWQAEQRLSRATIDARSRDLYELEQQMQCEKSNADALSQWKTGQAENAANALRHKQRLSHRLVVVFASLLTLGLFLLIERATIRRLHDDAEDPQFSDTQWTWMTMKTRAQRKIDELRALDQPRPTPEMTRAQKEVNLLGEKRDALEQEIRLQQTRVDLLRSQCM